MSEELKTYCTTREAADRLGVAVSTVQLWTNNGSLRAWTTGGGHRRIACSSVDEMLAQRQIDSGDKSPGHHLSMVIVEDNEQQLRLYKQQINSWNMSIDVVTAKDGYEGLVKIGKTIPDIIITDLKMPNMNGFQMVRALKVMPELQDSLIIVITGIREDEMEASGSLPDDIQVFTKPVQFKELEALLRQKLPSRVAQ